MIPILRQVSYLFCEIVPWLFLEFSKFAPSATKTTWSQKQGNIIAYINCCITNSSSFCSAVSLLIVLNYFTLCYALKKLTKQNILNPRFVPNDFLVP